MTAHPGSSDHEVTNEPDWARTHGHRVGMRDFNDRFPGLTHEGDDWRYEIEKEAEEKMDELKKMVEEGNLLTVRDYINKQEDLHLRRPDVHPKSWRYVVHTTEHHIKEEQPWFINQKKKQKEQEEQKKQQVDQQKEGLNQQQGRQQQRGDKMDTDQGEQDSKPELTAEQRLLINNMKEDQEHMRSIRPNDGQGRSPVCNILYPQEIDEADQFTPDNWVARSTHLMRLTGKHPLNGEAPLSEIYDAGFITPSPLHYVRNHGSVPHLLWERHKVEVTGGRTITIRMDDLADKFPSINIPIFMACDGTRRKELNMIQRTKGFNFGPGSIGCAYWRGALLRDVLLAANVSDLDRECSQKRLWVNFEGADELSEGKYSTCIPLEYAMDQCNDVLLAYAMNDNPLPPDHGYPVRLMIPGFVGGRTVKWLSKVWVSDKENDTHYHVYDNRVLPGNITTSDDLAEVMYHNPSTIINEQALNAVIVKPCQGEKINLADVRADFTYRIEGFAYNGSGDEVQRVELSLDGGKSWLYCVRKVGYTGVRRAETKIAYSTLTILYATGRNFGPGCIGTLTSIPPVCYVPRV